MLCLTAVVDLASGNIVNMHEVPANPVKLRGVLKKASAFFRFIFRPAFLPWLLSPEKLEFKADSITTDQGRGGFFRRLLSLDVLEEEGPEAVARKPGISFLRWLFSSETLPEEASIPNKAREKRFFSWLFALEDLGYQMPEPDNGQGRVGFFRRLLSSEVLEEEGPETMGGELRAGFFRWLFASEKLPEEAPQKLKR